MLLEPRRFVSPPAHALPCNQQMPRSDCTLPACLSGPIMLSYVGNPQRAILATSLRPASLGRSRAAARHTPCRPRLFLFYAAAASLFPRLYPCSSPAPKPAHLRFCFSKGHKNHAVHSTCPPVFGFIISLCRPFSAGPPHTAVLNPTPSVKACLLQTAQQALPCPSMLGRPQCLGNHFFARCHLNLAG